MSSTPKRTKAEGIRRKSTNAPGAYLGFSLQTTRFLARLLEANPGETVCLEVFDDVGVEKADGRRIAEQNKSSTSSANPLANRAIAFWKTLRNWIDSIQDGLLDPNRTTFEIYVSKPFHGSISSSFHDAQTLAAAADALRAARDVLWGSEPDFTLRKTVAATLAPQLDRVFGAFATDADLTATLVANLRIETGSGSPQLDLRPLLLHKLVGEDACDDVLRWAQGWVKQATDVLLERNQVARIPYDDFHAALLNYVRTHDRDTVLHSVASTPSASAVEAEVRFQTYIKQLQIIGADDVDLMAAANDYLRGIADRTAWADKSLIDAKSLATFESEIHTTWRNKREKALISLAASNATSQGRYIWRDCMDHAAAIDGLVVPLHFVRGSFHSLANAPSEAPTIGWHPDYHSELKKPVRGSKGK